MKATQTHPDGSATMTQGLHVVAKPIGPACNLACDYCFYLEKQALFDAGGQYRMTDRVLSAFIAGYISSQPAPVVEPAGEGAPSTASRPRTTTSRGCTTCAPGTGNSSCTSGSTCTS